MEKGYDGNGILDSHFPKDNPKYATSGVELPPSVTPTFDGRIDTPVHDTSADIPTTYPLASQGSLTGEI